MISVELARSVLSYLYQKYEKEDVPVRHDISEITSSYNLNAKKVGLNLLSCGFIENHTFSNGGNFLTNQNLMQKIRNLSENQNEESRMRFLSELKLENQKNQKIESGSFGCSISILGINEINPSYIKLNSQCIIMSIGRASSPMNLLEIEEIKHLGYHKILSLSIYLQKLGYLIINPFDGKIIAELTLFGKERIEFRRLT